MTPNPLKTPQQMMYEQAGLPHYAGGGKAAANVLGQFRNQIEAAIAKYTRATGKAPTAAEVKALEDHLISLKQPAPTKPITQARMQQQEPFANMFVDQSGRPYSAMTDPTGKVVTPERAKGLTTANQLGVDQDFKAMPSQFGSAPANMRAREKQYLPPHVNAFPPDEFMSQANTGRTSNRTWNKSFTESTEDLAARQQGVEAAADLGEEVGGLGALRTTEGDIPRMTSASEPFATQSAALEAPALSRLTDEILMGKHGELIDKAVADFRARGIEPDQEDIVNAINAMINPLRHNYTGVNPLGERPMPPRGRPTSQSQAEMEAWREKARASGLPEDTVSQPPADWPMQSRRNYLLDTTPEERGPFAKDWDLLDLEDKRRRALPQKAAGGMMGPRDMHAALLVNGYANGKKPEATPQWMIDELRRGPQFNSSADKVLYNAWAKRNTPHEDSMREYEPTARERIASTGQEFLEKAGIRRPIARRAAQTVTGGASSALPMGMGLVDAAGMVNPAAAAASTGFAIDDAIKAAAEGNYLESAMGLGMNLPAVSQLVKARNVGRGSLPSASNFPPNREAQIAQDYMRKNLDQPYYNYGGGMQAPTSAARQEWIGRTHDVGANAFTSNDPAYKAAVYASWVKNRPDIIRETGAQNYDQLMKASYEAAAKETAQQARLIPNKMEFWGPDEYAQKDYLAQAQSRGVKPAEFMRSELNQGKPFYVFKDETNPHPYLSGIDPVTGANENELFRGVHDYFGHLGTQKPNTFGPRGEENTWMSHRQMFSPLAEPAMTAETRGQNSYVNYVNAKNMELRKKGLPTTEFAQNKPVLLPAEASDPNYMGGLPEYLKGIVK